MSKNDKGVTLIALVVTVIVAIIIASISTYTGMETINNTKFQNAVAQLKVMQSEINSLYEQYKNGDDITKLEIMSQGEYINNTIRSNTKLYLGKDSIDDEYRLYTDEYIKNTLDIDGISYNFVINIRTREVILVGGIKNSEGIRCYTLEDTGEMYNVNYQGEY